MSDGLHIFVMTLFTTTLIYVYLLPILPDFRLRYKNENKNKIPSVDPPFKNNPEWPTCFTKANYLSRVNNITSANPIIFPLTKRPNVIPCSSPATQGQMCTFTSYLV